MTAPALPLDSTNRARISRNVDKMASQGATPEEIERYIQGEGLRPVTEADSDFDEYRRKHQTPADDFGAYRANHGEGSSPNQQRIQRNIARMKAAKAPREEIELYLRSEGAIPDGETPQQDTTAVDDFAAYRAKHQTSPESAAAFHGRGSGGALPTPVPMAEGVIRAVGQGLTLGGSDEMAAGLRAPFAAAFSDKSIGEEYTNERNRIRDRQHDFEHQHPTIAALTEALGSLPTSLAAGPAGLMRGGMAFGGASALGHAEGSAKSQAKATGLGAVLGGALAKGAQLLGKGGSKSLDLFNPKRIARREMATVIPEDAAQTFAARQNLVPRANVPGDLSKKTAALGKVLAKDSKSAITGPLNATERIKQVKTERKAIGAEYDALDRPLPTDPQIEALALRAGMPVTPGITSFAEIHRLRHEVQKQASRAAGMTKNDLLELKGNIDSWLKGHVPQVEGVDARYNELTKHLGNTLRSLREMDQGAVEAARRAAGGNTRQANRSLGMWHMLAQALRPSPARQARAMEKVAFTPKNAQSEMGKILSERQNILQGETPFVGRTMASQAAGAMAPQLSSDTTSARGQAIQMRSQGLSDAELTQQLGSTFTPELVRFIVAATPHRLAQ